MKPRINELMDKEMKGRKCFIPFTDHIFLVSFLHSSRNVMKQKEERSEGKGIIEEKSNDEEEGKREPLLLSSGVYTCAAAAKVKRGTRERVSDKDSLSHSIILSIL